MSDNTTEWSQWDALILQIIEEAIEELGEMVKDKVKASIDEHVYVGQNKIYEPTYEFRESWESENCNEGRTKGVEVKSNPDKMNVDKYNFQHGSKYQKQDIREYLPELLAFNLSGDFFGANQWWHNRDSYFEETMKQLGRNGWLNKTFKKLLRDRGLSVT